MSQLPLLRRFDCVRLSVPDLEAGLNFYRDQLGHELVWRTPDSVGLRMPECDAEIVLHTEAQPPEIDIKVQNADEAAAKIRAAGGRIIESPFDIRIGRCAVVEDPWGNQLVILDWSKGLLVTDADGNVIGNAPPES